MSRSHLRWEHDLTVERCRVFIHSHVNCLTSVGTIVKMNREQPWYTNNNGITLPCLQIERLTYAVGQSASRTSSLWYLITHLAKLDWNCIDVSGSINCDRARFAAMGPGCDYYYSLWKDHRAAAMRGILQSVIWKVYHHVAYIVFCACLLDALSCHIRDATRPSPYTIRLAQNAHHEAINQPSATTAIIDDWYSKRFFLLKLSCCLSDWNWPYICTDCSVRMASISFDQVEWLKDEVWMMFVEMKAKMFIKCYGGCCFRKKPVWRTKLINDGGVPFW